MRAVYSPMKMQERRGSSLLLVVATIGVLLAFWGIAYRMTASLIRVQSSLLTRQSRSDQAIPAMSALDSALTLVETSKPPSRQTYIYKFPPNFVVTYTPYNSAADIRDGLNDDDKKGWKVEVSPVPWVGPGTIDPLPVVPDQPYKPQWTTSPH